MMTYKWMRDVQGPKMKPWGIEFPNHYHAPPGSYQPPDTYSMEQFLAANALILKSQLLFFFPLAANALILKKQLHSGVCVVNI
jgi:hypothetical protein